MQIPPPRPAVASPPFDKGGTNKERFKIIYVCKAWSCRHQGKTWRFCGFPKGTLRKVASLALLTRSPQTQIICVCSSHFATHNGCPLCYEMARSSRRCKFVRILVGRLRNASRFARHVAVSPRHTNSGCPLFYWACRSSQFAAASTFCRFPKGTLGRAAGKALAHQG